MKIGILTLHSQLNYGGVLQCWALSTYLKQQGYDVVVLNHKMTPNGGNLKGVLAQTSIKAWLRFLIGGIIGNGVFARQVRMVRTMLFLKQSIPQTKWTFHCWNDANRQDIVDERLDAIIVGSDQVWNGTNPNDPLPYMLKDYPLDTPAIAYAPCFGMSQLLQGLEPIYKPLLARFAYLSSRERAGVEILKKMGFKATQVVDPVLLLKATDWHKFSYGACESIGRGRKRLFCYFLGVPLPEVEHDLTRAIVEGWNIDIFVDKWVQTRPISIRSAISKVVESITNLPKTIKTIVSRVNVHLSGGPSDFVRYISQSDAVLSDSFHALMFAAIFGKDVRIIRPTDPWRKSMFVRIQEFVDYAVGGPVIFDDIDAALSSIINGSHNSFNAEVIESLRSHSQSWLKNAIADISL